jgi:magnesium transporter
MHLERGPDYVYHLILDRIVDQYTPILDAFDDEIDQLEDEIFGKMNSHTLSKILNMKRQVFSMRRITTYQREMVYRLSRGEFDLITDDEIAYYRNVFDHLVRAAELAESYRDILAGLVDAYLSMTSNRLNEIMKVLAIISTFFLPLTFIVGVYGMNFDTSTSPYNMPELKWVFGYPFAWGVMIMTAIVMFIYFKRKKWL